jgi:hypothetical protein
LCEIKEEEGAQRPTQRSGDATPFPQTRAKIRVAGCESRRSLRLRLALLLSLNVFSDLGMISGPVPRTPQQTLEPPGISYFFIPEPRVSERVCPDQSEA